MCGSTVRLEAARLGDRKLLKQIAEVFPAAQTERPEQIHEVKKG